MPLISEACHRQLTEHILPFWLALKDETYGGFYGYVGYDLAVDRTYEKGCILNSRILWFFSEAALLLGNAEAKAAADHAYRFLSEHCVDQENGGVYWSLTYDGNPKDTTKHTYNQAFALYALGAYYRLTGNEEALELALGIFDLIEEHCTDAIGYLEAFTVDWGPESNEKLSENGVMAEKTMNTLLHVLEAYTQLYRLTKDERVKNCLLRILDILKKYVYNPVLKRQEVFFDRTYNSILDLHSYGHDIETAWLVDRTLEVLDDEKLTAEISPITVALAEQTLKVAFDGNSFANECEKGIVNTHRVWWVQAEAVVGFINAWQKTGEDKFLEAAKAQWKFIKTYLVDKREGSEWYWELDENGKPFENRPIVEPWKCPYHNGRMCFEIMDRLENK